MTTISTFYDALRTLVATTLTNAKQITLPYGDELGGVSSLILDNGYGIQIGPGTNLDGAISCTTKLGRTVTIVLTRAMALTQNDDTNVAVIEKEILEDQIALIKAIDRSGVTLAVSDVKFIADTGLEILTTQDRAGQYYVLASVFEVTYIENLAA